MKKLALAALLTAGLVAVTAAAYAEPRPGPAKPDLL